MKKIQILYPDPETKELRRAARNTKDFSAIEGLTAGDPPNI